MKIKCLFCAISIFMLHLFFSSDVPLCPLSPTQNWWQLLLFLVGHNGAITLSRPVHKLPKSGLISIAAGAAVFDWQFAYKKPRQSKQNSHINRTECLAGWQTFGCICRIDTIRLTLTDELQGLRFIWALDWHFYRRAWSVDVCLA